MSCTSVKYTIKYGGTEKEYYDWCALANLKMHRSFYVVVTEMIMTELEFQMQNEISELRSTINGLRAEIKQREEAYNEMQGMFDNCQRKLSEALQREEIAKKVIADQRNEINELRGNK